MTAFPTYSTGTVSIGAAATSVAGVGSDWQGVNAKPGDTLSCGGHEVTIMDVIDAFTLQIEAWPFTAIAPGTAYKIIKDSPLRFAGGQVSLDAQTIVGALDSDGYFFFVDGTESVPDPSLGNDNQYAFKPGTGQVWLKTGGVWVIQPQADASAFGCVFAIDYGVQGDGGTYTTQFQAAINAAAGRPIILPSGSFNHTGVTYSPSSAESPGFQLFGPGPEVCTIHYSGTLPGYNITLDTASDSEFQYFTNIKGVKLTGAGLFIRKQDFFAMENFKLSSITGDAIHIAGAGDPASSSVLRLKNGEIGPCTGWAISGLPDATHTELSGLHVDDVLIFSCGTSSVSVPPTSGGIAWRGLNCQIDNTSWTETQNVALYIAASGTASNLHLKSVDFENCESTVLPSIYCDTGLRICTMIGVELLQGAAPLVNQGGIWFTSVIGNLTIDGVKVRVDPANNPWIAFKSTGTSIKGTNHIRNVWWLTYDGTGQTRYSGFVFDEIVPQCQFSITGTNSALLKSAGYGGKMPLYLGGLSGSGEWISYEIGSSGVTLALTTQTPTTLYHFYFDNSGGDTPVGRLSFSTTAPVVSFPGAYATMTGDPSKLWVGDWTTDGSGNFQAAGVGFSVYPLGGPQTSSLGGMPYYATNTTLGIITAGSVGSVLQGSGAGSPGLFTRNPQLGIAGVARGTLDFANTTSGVLRLQPPNTGALGTSTITFPIGTTDFSSTGGAGQALKQTSAGGAITVAKIDISELATAGNAPAFTLGGTITGNSQNLTGIAALTATSVTAASQYGGSLAGSTATINGTSNGSPSSAFLNLQSNGQFVSIGNTSPKTLLDVNKNLSSSPSLILSTSVAKFQGADSSNSGIEIIAYGNGFGPAVAGGAAGGTASAPTGTTSGTFMMNTRGTGYNGSAWALGGSWGIVANEAWSAGHQGTHHEWYTTPNASTTPQLGMALNASGGFYVGQSIVDGGAGSIVAAGRIRPGSCTVATLPSSPSAGDTIFCSNVRVFNGAGIQEGAGVGTGGLVTYNGAWKIEGTNVTAVA